MALEMQLKVIMILRRRKWALEECQIKRTLDLQRSFELPSFVPADGPCVWSPGDDCLSALRKLMDALMQSQSDCPEASWNESDMLNSLSMRLACLYGLVAQRKDTISVGHYSHEHHQYHYDRCARASYSTRPFTAHRSKIRQAP